MKFNLAKEKTEQKRLLSNSTDDSQESPKDYGAIISNSEERQAPRDYFNMAYILFFIQGIGMLLPWNFFITANGYFRFKFQNDVAIKNTFENAFSVAAQLPNTAALIINLYLTGRVSRGLRVVLSLAITTACFITTAIFVNVDTNNWTHKFFDITVLCVAVINFCCGIYQGTIFGMAAMTGQRYMQSAMVGLGLSGIMAALANLISLAVGKNLKASAVGYFSTAAAVTFICILAYIMLLRMNVMKFYLKNVDKEEMESSGSTDTTRTSSSLSESIRSTWFAFKQIYPMALSACFTFFVTLSLMPSVLSNIVSVNASNNSIWTNKYFSDLTCFLLFNAGDMVGRIVAGNVQLFKKTGPGLPFFCFLRIIFIPLFALCNYQPRSYLPVVFDHDFIPVVLTFAFALSNGYYAGLCMMYGPQLVTSEYVENTGVIMQLFVTIGLSLGSGFSYVIVKFI